MDDPFGILSKDGDGAAPKSSTIDDDFDALFGSIGGGGGDGQSEGFEDDEDVGDEIDTLDAIKSDSNATKSDSGQQQLVNCPVLPTAAAGVKPASGDLLGSTTLPSTAEDTSPGKDLFSFDDNDPGLDNLLLAPTLAGKKVDDKAVSDKKVDPFDDLFEPSPCADAKAQSDDTDTRSDFLGSSLASAKTVGDDYIAVSSSSHKKDNLNDEDLFGTSPAVKQQQGGGTALDIGHKDALDDDNDMLFVPTPATTATGKVGKENKALINENRNKIDDLFGRNTADNNMGDLFGPSPDAKNNKDMDDNKKVSATTLDDIFGTSSTTTITSTNDLFGDLSDSKNEEGDGGDFLEIFASSAKSSSSTKDKGDSKGSRKDVSGQDNWTSTTIASTPADGTAEVGGTGSEPDRQRQGSSNISVDLFADLPSSKSASSSSCDPLANNESNPDALACADLDANRGEPMEMDDQENSRTPKSQVPDILDFLTPDLPDPSTLEDQSKNVDEFVSSPTNDAGPDSSDVKLLLTNASMDMDASVTTGSKVTETEMADQTDGGAKKDAAPLDFSVLSLPDNAHLNVDVNKHKRALTKKGSLALRKRPTRRAIRSTESEAEDALFKDSTEPKPPCPMDDKDEDDVTEDRKLESMFESGDRLEPSEPKKSKTPPKGLTGGVLIPGLLEGLKKAKPFTKTDDKNSANKDRKEVEEKEQKTKSFAVASKSLKDSQNQSIAQTSVKPSELKKPPAGAFKLPALKPVSPSEKTKSPAKLPPPVASKPSLVVKPKLAPIDNQKTSFSSPPLVKNGVDETDSPKFTSSEKAGLKSISSDKASPFASLKSTDKTSLSVSLNSTSSNNTSPSVNLKSTTSDKRNPLVGLKSTSSDNSSPAASPKSTTSDKGNPLVSLKSTSSDNSSPVASLKSTTSDKSRPSPGSSTPSLPKPSTTPSRSSVPASLRPKPFTPPKPKPFTPPKPSSVSSLKPKPADNNDSDKPEALDTNVEQDVDAIDGAPPTTRRKSSVSGVSSVQFSSSAENKSAPRKSSISGSAYAPMGFKTAMERSLSTEGGSDKSRTNSVSSSEGSAANPKSRTSSILETSEVEKDEKEKNSSNPEKVEETKPAKEVKDSEPSVDKEKEMSETDKEGKDIETNGEKAKDVSNKDENTRLSGVSMEKSNGNAAGKPEKLAPKPAFGIQLRKVDKKPPPPSKPSVNQTKESESPTNWRQSLANKRNSFSPKEPSTKESKEADVPDWVKASAERRKRLVDSGVIKSVAK